MVGSNPHFVTWHGIVGTVIWILVWIQYFSGWLRPPAKMDGTLRVSILSFYFFLVSFCLFSVREKNRH